MLITTDEGGFWLQSSADILMFRYGPDSAAHRFPTSQHVVSRMSQECQHRPCSLYLRCICGDTSSTYAEHGLTMRSEQSCHLPTPCGCGAPPSISLELETRDVIGCFAFRASRIGCRDLRVCSSLHTHMRVLLSSLTIRPTHSHRRVIIEINMTSRRPFAASTSPEPAAKRRKRSSPSPTPLFDLADADDRFGREYGSKWKDWPAPESQMDRAAAFVRDM
jgi:hypothetical protein